MKRISLLRHAKSSWDDPALLDSERPLAKRGKRNSKQIARLAAQCLPAPDLILTSTSQRTIATAVRLLKRWPQVPVQTRSVLYLASAATLLKQLAQLPDEIDHVLVVAHHPGLSELACKLSSCSEHWLPKKSPDETTQAEPTLVTGALLSFTAPVAHWNEIPGIDASLDTLLTPADGIVISSDKSPKFSVVRKALLVDIEHLLPIFAAAGEPSPDVVHFLRTRIKRLRAALRLLRHGKGDTQWRNYDRILQKVAHHYAAIRELDVCIARLNPDVDQLMLWQQQRTRLLQTYLKPAVLRSAHQWLKDLQVELQSWPVAAIADTAITTALKNSYRRARKQWRLVTADNNELLHRCRILTKRLFIQADIVGRLQHQKRVQQRLEELMDLLGEQHDAVVMLADPHVPQKQKTALEKRMQKLAKRAIKKGQSVFSPRHPAWLARI